MSELLLIIDTQEGFRSQQTLQIIPILKEISSTFKGHVFYTQFINEKNSLFEKQLQWTCFQTEQEQEILSELHPLNGSIASHTGYTVLTDELKRWIQDHSVTSVYLSGIYTDVCIVKTAMDLFDAGIECFVLKDACHSLHGQDNHERALDSLSHIIGKDHIIISRELSLG